MSKIKQLLQMHQQGCMKKEIARTLGMSKNTVKAYLEKYQLLPYGIEALLEMDDPILESKFHAGNPSYKENQRYDDLQDSIKYFESELKRPGVTRKLLWEEYRQQHTDGYGYTQFCYHLNQLLKAQKPSMILEHKAGEKLFVDFAGKKAPYVDIETGEIIECPVFVACLPYSDYSFIMPVKSQCIADFIYALQTCLEYLGGVPQILVTDNLKSAIVKADNYEPEVTRALEDFCNYYGMTLLPARVRKPKDKALVENQVKLAYNRVYAKLRNITFYGITPMTDAYWEKNRDHNQTRMQKKPYCREEKFLSDEKPKLRALPNEPYEIKYYREYTVEKNNHILLGQDNHYYSVPYQWIGHKVKVIYTRTLVSIYAKGEQIAVHPREFHTKYTTTNEHLCSHHQHYLSRSPEYYHKMAEKKSELLVILIDALFKGGRPPEQNYRTCDGLFNLHRKTDIEIFNRACEIALASQKYSYRFVMEKIENLKKMPNIQQEPDYKPLPEHENIRGKGYYEQLTLK